MIIDTRRKAHPNVVALRRNLFRSCRHVDPFAARHFIFPHLISDFQFEPSRALTNLSDAYISSYDENDNDDAPGLMTKSDEVNIPRWIRIMETFSVIRPP